VAYLDRRDRNHRRAVKVLRQALKRGARLCTTSPIVSEILTYARAFGGRDAPERVMDFLLALMGDARLDLVHPSADEFMAACRIFAAHPAPGFSFPDASLVRLGERLCATRAFGYDADFTSLDLKLLG
jgi:predicted nucleic acid-binding protein